MYEALSALQNWAILWKLDQSVEKPCYKNNAIIN